MILRPAKSDARVLAIMEASTVTGPAKNLIDFCLRARGFEAEARDFPSIDTSIITFERVGSNDASPEFVEGRNLILQNSRNPFVTAAREAGVETSVIGERFRFDRRVIRALGRILESKAPDIVQTHNVKSHFLFRLSGPANRRPWIAFHHGYTTTSLTMQAYNQLDRWSLRAADRVVTVSQAFARDLARLGVRQDRIRVLHNSVDASRAASEEITEAARSLKARMGIASGERIILSVGRLSHEKGHADLIDALDALRGLHAESRARLVIVGDGPERPRLEAAAARLGLADRIVFAGQVHNVRPYYAMADLLALPSHSEGSPNVLLEAMAAKLPVVATRVGGVPEIVTDGESALLVKSGDPRAMAHAMEAALKDDALRSRLALRAYETAVSRHSPEARLRVLLNIYRELIPESGRGELSDELSREFSIPDDLVPDASGLSRNLDRKPTA